jgi:hypothetical protein
MDDAGWLAAVQNRKVADMRQTHNVMSEPKRVSKL